MKLAKKIPYKWEMIILLWFAFFLNQGDRQVFNSVLPLIKSGLHLSDIQLGLVATMFTIVYGLLVPLAGFAGDIFKRKSVVIMSLAIFSTGTLLTGFAGGLMLLIIYRSIATGAGEAFYYPAANSLIGHYHTKSRAQAMAIHQTALYTGVVVGGFLSAWMGEKFGWRAPFIVYGILGLGLAAILFFRLKNPDSDKSMSEESTQTRIGIKEVLLAVSKTPTILYLSLAFGCMIFVNVGYLTWTPTFLYEKFGLSIANAGFSSMFYHHLAAYAGVLLGARVSDNWSKKRKQIRMETEIAGALLGAPFIVLIGISPSLAVTYLALAAFGLFRGVYDSNLFAVLFDVVEPKYRSSAAGLMLSFGFIAGALSPILLGFMKTVIGLDRSLAGLGIFYVLAGFSVWIGLKLFFNRDYIEERDVQIAG